MKKEINVSKKIFIVILIVILCTFVSFIFINDFFHRSKNTNLKDSISLAISFASVLATLSASYVASLLFNKWQDQHNKIVDKEITFGVISSLNDFLLATQHFYNSYNQVIESLKINNYKIDQENLTEILAYLRNVILEHEHSIVLVANNFSDLAGVMSEDEYQKFNTNFLVVLECSQLAHKKFIEIINDLKKNQNNEQILQATFGVFSEVLNFLALSEGNIIDRTKSIKLELARFYRA